MTGDSHHKKCKVEDTGVTSLNTKRKNCQFRILHPEKNTSVKERQINTFMNERTNKQSWKNSLPAGLYYKQC